LSPLEPGSFNLNNKIADSGWTYDSRGNVTKQVTGETFAYDAENRQVAYCPQDANPATCTQAAGNGRTLYYYDGNGARVLTQAPDGTVTRFLYDSMGNLAAEYTTAALAAPVCATCYVTTDHLGSTRVVTDSGGCAVFRQDYLPFGEKILAQSGSPRLTATGGTVCGTNGYVPAASPVRDQFTGKERDVETGLDFFGARYFSGAQGRFTSADYVGDGLDPVAIPWADYRNPQSLNLYDYARNNPLGNTDPDGHDCVVQTRNSETSETVTVSAGNCDKINVGDGQTKTYIAGVVDTTSIKSNGDGGITFGYTPYTGGGGVADLKAAPIPDFPGIAYGWGNNAAGYRTIASAESVASVRGAATFYGASAAAAVCVLFCAEAAASAGEVSATLNAAQNELVIKAIAYLESAGLPANWAAKAAVTAAAAAFGQPGAFTALGQGWRQLVPKLNETVREYRQTHGARQ